MSEISGLKSSDKVFFLTNIIPIMMSSMPKRLSCIILYIFGLHRIKLYA
jgi:hypothetical protein